MKRSFLTSAVLIIAGVGLLAGSAMAIPYTDYYDAEEFMSLGETVSWTFDITDDGFDPITQDVTSATVSLYLHDDRYDPWFQPFEVGYLGVGLNSFIWEVDTGIERFSLRSVMTLSNYGTVDASLTSILGDFYFKGAKLMAEGTAPVPEPATMLLFGTGLAGLAGVARRKKAQKK